MRICILGAGKMGTWLSDALCLNHDVAIYDTDLSRLKFIFKTRRFTELKEISDFKPQLLINAVTLKYTIEVFKKVSKYIPKECIISDISSVKTNFKEFYESSGFRYVSTHPMFGPTFGNLNELSRHHAIIINEGDSEGIKFYEDFFKSLKLNIHHYSFIEHDKTIAYSLSVPFASTLVFASCMKHQDAPGTTFEKHYSIAKGLLSEDDYLLSEILFNPFTGKQVENIRLKLKELLNIIDEKDSEKMKIFLKEVRDRMK